MVLDRGGLVVNVRGAWPDPAELTALDVAWVRSLVYDFDELERALQTLPGRVQVIALLNSETQGVALQEGDDPPNLDGWEPTVATFARRFGGVVQAVECLNEWDALGYSPQVAADCARLARPLLQAARIRCLLGSVSGPEWPAALRAAVRALPQAERQLLAGVCLHPYGQRASGFPTSFGFGELDQVVQQAQQIAGLPVWLTEFGIKLADVVSALADAVGLEPSELTEAEQLALGDVGQMVYLRKAYQVLDALPPSILAAACYFCWRDDVGAPAERGLNAFGLRDVTGIPRPAWDAYAALAGGIEATAA